MEIIWFFGVLFAVTYRGDLNILWCYILRTLEAGFNMAYYWSYRLSSELIVFFLTLNPGLKFEWNTPKPFNRLNTKNFFLVKPVMHTLKHPKRRFLLTADLVLESPGWRKESSRCACNTVNSFFICAHFIIFTFLVYQLIFLKV